MSLKDKNALVANLELIADSPEQAESLAQILSPIAEVLNSSRLNAIYEDGFFEPPIHKRKGVEFTHQEKLAEYVSNITSVVDKFKNDGLTLESYIKAAVKQRQLYIQKPEGLIANITGVVDKLKDYGLTQKDYIKAAVKQPSLFYQNPATVEANILGLANKFKEQGLTIEKSIELAVRQPALFTQNPDTIEANIIGLVDKFKSRGLTLEGYIKAAIKQPVLFCQKPDTVAKKIEILQDLFNLELFKSNNAGEKSNLNNQPAFWQMIIDNPVLVSLSESNLTMRSFVADITGNNVTDVYKEPKVSSKKRLHAVLNDRLKDKEPNGKGLSFTQRVQQSRNPVLKDLKKALCK